MATIKPFAALRPDPDRARQICELPYDVLTSDEARQLAAGNPLSFFHVSKPEIDLEPGIGIYEPAVYERGRRNFLEWIAAGVLKQDARPCFYLYRQIMGRHSQLGLVAVASCEDYLQNIIKKHELTRMEKENDRVRHIEALNAQTGPAFLVYPADTQLDDVIRRRAEGTPDIDFTAVDGVRHTSWTIREAATEEFIEQSFARMSALYIADGHHRTAAAARVAKQRPGSGPNANFLSVLFPDNQVQILPYHRVLVDLNGLSAAELLKKLEGVFIIKKDSQPTPSRRHELGMYLEGVWHSLNFRPHFVATTDPLAKLDVKLLQDFVLAPVFGIEDPRTSSRINFVGGIRGTPELERLVNSGQYACAFSMFPTGIEELMRVAAAGGIMPPKSTWFEPKLRDGMFSHLLE